MELHNAKIDGFKNLKNIDISFSKLSALVAINNYGKSNVMEAISFIADYITKSKENKRKMMANKSHIPINTNHHPSIFSAQLSASIKSGNENYLVEYSFAFTWVLKNKNGKITSECLKIKQDLPGQKFTTVIKRDDSAAYYKTSKTGRCSNKSIIEDDDLILNKLQAFDDLYYGFIIDELNGIEAYVDHHLDASSSYIPDPIIRKDFDELDLNTLDNIPRIVFFLKEKHPDKYSRLEDAYKQLFPNITEIRIREIRMNAVTKSTDSSLDDDLPYVLTDKIYFMDFTDENLLGPLSFDQLSDGAKRVFVILTCAVIADIKHIPLLAFEEPETCVHPSMLQSLLRILEQLVGEECKILIASHSPYLVSYLNPLNIYAGVPTKEGVAEFHRIAKAEKLVKDAYTFKCSMGDLLFDLMSSDDTEELMKYLERSDRG